MKKKRILSLIAAAATASSLMCSVAAPAYAVDTENTAVAGTSEADELIERDSSVVQFNDTSYKIGDVNRDGVVNAVDASQVLREYSNLMTGGEPSFDEETFLLADLDSNGAIESIDAVLIQNAYHESSAEFTEHGDPYGGYSKNEIKNSKCKPKIEVETVNLTFDQAYDLARNHDSIPVNVYISGGALGIYEEYSTFGLHINWNPDYVEGHWYNYGDELQLQSGYDDKPVVRGDAINSFALKYSYDDKQYSSNTGTFISGISSWDSGTDGILCTLNFRLPEDFGNYNNPSWATETFIPIQVDYQDGDLFTNIDNDETGKLMQAYLFSNIQNGGIHIEKPFIIPHLNGICTSQDITMKVGERFNMQFLYDGVQGYQYQNTTFKIDSSQSVISVDTYNGSIKALKEGTTTFTVSGFYSWDPKYDITVTVLSDEEITTTTTSTTTTSTTTTTSATTTSMTTTSTTTTSTESTTTTEETTTTTTSTTTTEPVITTTSTAKYFASIEDMCDMAVKDYEQKNDVTPAETESIENNDGTVSIYLKDENGEVLDTYVIDTATGKGTNAADEEVNLPQTGNNSPTNLLAILSSIAMTFAGLFIMFKSGMIHKKEEK